MAETNSTPSTPSTQAEPQAEQPQPLLAYDPAHEDILIGEIPEIYFAMHCSLMAILKDRNDKLDPQMRKQLIAIRTDAEQLWYALMRLGKEAHQVQR